jgi:15-cis-phytoene desaturase
VVVGAGLAGLSAALELRRRGSDVVLLEARDVVGGRTRSWNEDGMEVESGLHRYLGFYSALPGLLRRAGIDPSEVVTWEDEVEIRMPDGEPAAVIGASLLHRPLKTIGGLLGNGQFWTVGDRLRLARFFLMGAIDYWTRPGRLDAETVSGYAARHGVNRRMLERVLVAFTAGIFFLDPGRHSAYGIFSPLMRASLRLPKMRIGAFAGGMSEVMTEPLARAVAEAGGEVRRGTPVMELVVDGERVTGVEMAGERLEADHVVVATGLAAAQELLRPPFGGHSWFAPMLRLPSLPAASLQLELDEPALPLDRTTFAPLTCLASFAEQSRTTFRRSAGRLSIILSPPERFLALEPEEVLAAVLADARRVGLRLEGRIRAYPVVVQPFDFYALVPGSEALRPTQETPVPGLALAGDYTRQPWVTTMEGAVISGERAAAAVAGSLKLPSRESPRPSRPRPRPLGLAGRAGGRP